jgi:hypothetical protein
VQRLDVGKRYFVYVTNAAGLYHYDMNDIVEVVGHYRQTPLIRFIQKRKGVVFFTAEKLYEVQVIAAVDNALAQLRGTYHFIAAVARVEGRGDATPGLPHRVDDAVTDADGAVLVDRIDAALGDQNSDASRSPRRRSSVLSPTPERSLAQAWGEVARRDGGEAVGIDLRRQLPRPRDEPGRVDAVRRVGGVALDAVRGTS